MRQFFLSIPKDLEEAATLDGASRFRILWQIFVPLSRPAIATLAIFSFLYAWNSFLWPLLIINEANVNNHVLTLALIKLRQHCGGPPQHRLDGRSDCHLAAHDHLCVSAALLYRGDRFLGVEGLKWHQAISRGSRRFWG